MDAWPLLRGSGAVDGDTRPSPCWDPAGREETGAPGVGAGRSDYQPFIDNSIPSGGLFTGAELRKTEEQAAIWGGTAGEQFDPCYHLACDTLQNVDRRALRINSHVIAIVMLTFAYSTEAVNGVPGKQVPGRPVHLPAPAGPEGTFAGEAGGRLHHGATA